MKKKILFFPGLGEKPDQYKALSTYMDIANIDWNTGKHTPKITGHDTLISFSLGAAFPLEYIQKHKVNKLILCSPPPFEKIGKPKANEIIFLVGEKEKFVHESIVRAVGKKYKIVIIPKADHEIKGAYLKKLIELLG